MIRSESPMSLDALEPRRFLSAGDLDPTFGYRGTSIQDQFGEAFNVALQNTPAASHILVQTSSGLVGLKLNGSLDRHFGYRGVVSQYYTSLSDPIVLTDGRILVAGNVSGEMAIEPFVMRLTPQGQPDTTFGPSHTGKVTIPFGGSIRALLYADIAIQPSGKIIVAGSVSDPKDPSGFATYASIIRLNADGSLDPTFGQSGQAIFDHFSTFPFWYGTGRILIARDGSIIMSGYTGSMDFGTTATSLTFSPDGKTVVESVNHGSDDGHGADTHYTGAAIRSDGTLAFTMTKYLNGVSMIQIGDKTLPFQFNAPVPTGTLFSSASLTNYLGPIATTRDNKVLLAATSYNVPALTIARLNPDGSPDLTFGHGGTSYVTLRPYRDGWTGQQSINGMMLLPNGDILAVGGSRHRMLVVRIQGGAHPPDTTRPKAVALDPPSPATLEFGVFFNASNPINIATLDDRDILVTGPKGFAAYATFKKNLSSNVAPAFARYEIKDPPASWGLANDGVYTITLLPHSVYDTAGRVAPGKALGTFKVNSSISPFPPSTPTIDLVNAVDPVPGAASVPFQIRYGGASNFDPATLGNDDILVIDANGTSAFAAFKSSKLQSDGQTYIADYVLAAPRGKWDVFANGEYTMRDARSDLLLDPHAGNKFASFTVAIKT